jgi:hypothetical protein
VDEGFLFWQAFRATKEMMNEIIHLCWFAGSDKLCRAVSAFSFQAIVFFSLSTSLSLSKSAA